MKSRNRRDWILENTKRYDHEPDDYPENPAYHDDGFMDESWPFLISGIPEAYYGYSP